MTRSDSVACNLPVVAWSATIRDRYEIWYGKLVGLDPSRPSALWFRYTLECHGGGKAPEAIAWATWFEDPTAGPFTLVRNFPLPPTGARSDTGSPASAHGFAVELAPDCSFACDAATRRYRARGSLRDQGRSIAWDLSWPDAGPAFRYLASDALRRLISPSGASSPCPDARMEGQVTIDDGTGPRTFEVSAGAGQQGHIFGARKPESWAWAHCNRFVDADSGEPVEAAFEAIHVVRQRGGRPLTSMYLRWGGKHHHFNRVLDLIPHRRALLVGPRVGNWAHRTHDRLELERFGTPSIRGVFELLPGHVAAVDYADTDGSTLANRNGTLARAELTIEDGSRRRRLRSDWGATLELVDRRGM